MANINNNLKKDVLAGAKLNMKESAKSAGTRFEGATKDEHVKGWMEEHGPSHVKYLSSTSKDGVIRITGNLTKAQLTELTKLGCKMNADTITFSAANKLAVEKALNLNSSATLNIAESSRAAGNRFQGADKEEHVKGWMEEHGPSHVEYLSSTSKDGVIRIAGNLTKAQLGELTALGCKLNGDTVAFSAANKLAVEKVLNYKK